jgi:hypothetical protein
VRLHDALELVLDLAELGVLYNEERSSPIYPDTGEKARARKAIEMVEALLITPSYRDWCAVCQRTTAGPICKECMCCPLHCDKSSDAHNQGGD